VELDVDDEVPGPNSGRRHERTPGYYIFFCNDIGDALALYAILHPLPIRAGVIGQPLTARRVLGIAQREGLGKGSGEGRCPSSVMAITQKISGERLGPSPETCIFTMHTACP
jgi:hypothetical protein